MPSVTEPPENHVTQLIDAAARGDSAALDQLLPLVYDQLRAAARHLLASERPGHTLQPTALVHDAYLKLFGPRDIPWQNRSHFYAAGAQAMRRILIDHARAKAARGGSAKAAHPAVLADLPDLFSLAHAEPDTILAVDAALVRLESEDPRAAEVVRLRFFAGLSVDQTAAAMGISPRSAARLWDFARARLHMLLEHAG